MENNSVLFTESFQWQNKMKGLWPSPLPDLNPYYFHQWDALKDKVCSNNNKCNEDNLKESIRNLVFPISTSKLWPITNKCMFEILCVCKPKETIPNIFFKCGEYKIKWYPQQTELKHTDSNPWQTATAVIAALPAVKLNCWKVEECTTLSEKCWYSLEIENA